jgi:hypothetical protein
VLLLLLLLLLQVRPHLTDWLSTTSYNYIKRTCCCCCCCFAAAQASPDRLALHHKLQLYKAHMLLLLQLCCRAGLT